MIAVGDIYKLGAQCSYHKLDYLSAPDNDFWGTMFIFNFIGPAAGIYSPKHKYKICVASYQVNMFISVLLFTSLESIYSLSWAISWAISGTIMRTDLSLEIHGCKCVSDQLFAAVPELSRNSLIIDYDLIFSKLDEIEEKILTNPEY